MITVTVRRHYPDATHYTTNESGVLRIWDGLDLIAQYEAGIEHEVSYEPPLLAEGADSAAGSDAALAGAAP